MGLKYFIGICDANNKIALIVGGLMTVSKCWNDILKTVYMYWCKYK